MTRKLRPVELALWAALPVAHTSCIEGRLRMILDRTRPRREPTRRFLLTALGLGAAALIPLAMLRPVARAQAAPPRPGMLAPKDAAAAVKHLRQIYAYIGIYRRTHGGAYPATYGRHSLAADMAAVPHRYGLPDRGAGNAEQAHRFFLTRPGTFSDGYFLHDKRPDGTLVGTTKQAGTRDVFAYNNSFVYNSPHNLAGFWLVLWDDGTVGSVPESAMRLVPAYDVIGPPYVTAAARRGGKIQWAFPGQAGLRGVKSHQP